ncbi:hypothetical protein F7725_027672 [Dissostichus mawsoni]|uniref:DUF4592 domain-containing protein n=1 Tax=Dissostichus mawsoni TaxID=36200 RepID=A0A7J5XDP8_DISMA|nr:hypothetical protein F7725_027672 [Dissostichus mawsoni]
MRRRSNALEHKLRIPFKVLIGADEVIGHGTGKQALHWLPHKHELEVVLEAILDLLGFKRGQKLQVAAVVHLDADVHTLQSPVQNLQDPLPVGAGHLGDVAVQEVVLIVHQDVLQQRLPLQGAPGLSLPTCRMKSCRFPAPRGGGVSMLLSIPFSIMSSRPPEATITRKVRTEGSTAELRRTEPGITVVLKFITELFRGPPDFFIPKSCLRGSIPHPPFSIRTDGACVSLSGTRSISNTKGSELPELYLSADHKEASRWEKKVLGFFPFLPYCFATDRSNKPKLSLFCIYFTVFSQSNSGGSIKALLGKTSFVQKNRSMFPKVLLQWCAAVSSCAAEIGKTRLRQVRPSALSASYLCCEVMALNRYNTKPCLWTLRCVTIQMMLSCWVVSRAQYRPRCAVTMATDATETKHEMLLEREDDRANSSPSNGSSGERRREAKGGFDGAELKASFSTGEVRNGVVSDDEESSQNLRDLNPIGSRALSHDSIFIPEEPATEAGLDHSMSQENVSDKVRNLQVGLVAKQIAQGIKFGQRPPSLRKSEGDEGSSDEEEVPRSPLKVLAQVEAEPAITEPKVQGAHQAGPHSTPVKSPRSKRVIPPTGTIESINLDSVPQSVPRLDNTAARHKLSVKPKNQRISRKHRRFTQDLQEVDIPGVLQEDFEAAGFSTDAQRRASVESLGNFKKQRLHEEERQETRRRRDLELQRLRQEEEERRKRAAEELRLRQLEEERCRKQQEEKERKLREETERRRIEEERRIREEDEKRRREEEERMRREEEEERRMREEEERRRMEEQRRKEEEEEARRQQELEAEKKRKLREEEEQRRKRR